MPKQSEKSKNEEALEAGYIRTKEGEVTVLTKITKNND